MRDENQSGTLGDYSRPSHEGHRNTTELPGGANRPSLLSDTIRLVQNGYAFHGLRSKDPNQHLKDFIKLMDSLKLIGADRERIRLRLLQFSLRDQASNWFERLPARSISTWEDFTTLHIFYDHIDRTTQFNMDCAGGRLRKMGTKEARETIEELAKYEEEEWDDPIFPGSHDYENSNMDRLLGSLECQNMIRQLEECMGRRRSDFMQLSLNVVERLKEEINTREDEHDQPNKIQKINSYRDTKELVRGQCHRARTRRAQPQQKEQEEEEEDQMNKDGVGGSGDVYWKPHMQMNLFPGRERDYPPIGYTKKMPHGYDYRYDTAFVMAPADVVLSLTFL
ncbi:hypothetical protein Tco_0085749 [Tanacetum coccineum]